MVRSCSPQNRVTVRNESKILGAGVNKNEIGRYPDAFQLYG